ncbi:hypothetical protein KYJ26_20215 [Bacillus sp. MCCB 382]|uniref:hypothetical protein n=1 Tax=Bacillus sp. MCCB 382 TaxID=2860197 RepID=UPI001C5A3E36|nr:hypothetical protein [Bacillus sp. MCCB 382]
MFGTKKCKQCKKKVDKSEIVAREYCSEECKETWQDANLRPWQKALNNGVDKWAGKPKK